MKLILEIDLAKFDPIFLKCHINRLAYNMSKLENTDAPKQIKKRGNKDINKNKKKMVV